MSAQKMYYETLSKTQKKTFEKQLESDGKFICLGMLCKGKIKNMKEFPFKDIHKCSKCYRESLLFKHNRTLKKVYRNVKHERIVNREIINEVNIFLKY